MPRIDDNYWLATGPWDDLPPDYPHRGNWYPEPSKYYMMKRAPDRAAGWMSVGSVRRNAAAPWLKGLMKLAVEGGFDAPDRR